MTHASELSLRGVWRDRPMFILLAVSFACVLAANLVTVLVNVPINHAIRAFNPAALPENWPVLRERWWHWHLIRTAALLPGMCLAFLAVVMRLKLKGER